MGLLAVNAGSTSVKVTVVDGGVRTASFGSLEDGLAAAAASDGTIDAVVHRVVHGGERTSPELIDDEVLAQLRALTPMAPLHQPAALDAIDRCRVALPRTPQIACFDTAFHATIPAAARTYALPARWRRQVRVYGFHGLSHAWSAGRVAELMPRARRVLIAHLGGGQSLCGVLDGYSVATTMGFTPVDGLVMATRSGAVDPGALLYLLGHADDDLSQDDPSAVLEEQSGLLGLCGTADMAEVVTRAEGGDVDAAFALDVWTERFVRLAGGCVAAMGGLDALVFTGGIGEHSPAIRARVAERLAWLGVSIDDQISADGGGDEVEVSAGGATVRSFVIRAAEDLAMATEVGVVLSADGPDGASHSSV
jgi:acetate kinase